MIPVCALQCTNNELITFKKSLDSSVYPIVMSFGLRLIISKYSLGLLHLSCCQWFRGVSDFVRIESTAPVFNLSKGVLSQRQGIYHQNRVQDSCVCSMEMSF